MKRLVKSAQVIGCILGLIIGDKFTTPGLEMLERYPTIIVGG